LITTLLNLFKKLFIFNIDSISLVTRQPEQTLLNKELGTNNMPKRVQSPSSINIYKQCPRRYFYQYIKKLPTYPSIHTLRGNIVHSTLELFYELDPQTLDEANWRVDMANYARNLFEALWKKNRNSLLKLAGSEEKYYFFYQESAQMLANWMNAFFSKFSKLLQENTLLQAWEKIRPIAREIEYKSRELSVRGFIDCIEEIDGKIRLIDYKTSKLKKEFPKEYRLQLAIYALMYKEKHGKLPDEASVWFLRGEEVVVPITEELVKDALFEVEQIHFNTQSEHISDYPVNITPLCKWRGGQCDFYNVCIKERHL
jgi:ATP-dependent exoDNAse (exonuclease V) beta subunit